jgi:phosphoglycerate dehydrogenase-like enzyme
MNVAVCSRSFSRNSALRGELQNRYDKVKFNDQGVSFDNQTLVDFLDGYAAAIVGLETINSEVLDRLPLLKVVGKYGVGLDKIDFLACARNDVRVGWTPGVNALAVAELALNLSMTIVRCSAVSHNIVKQGKWEQTLGRELSSLTIGILGCGYVGAALLRLLSGFGCNTLVHDKVDKSEICKLFGAKQVDFDSLVQNSDLISIHLPENEATKRLLGRGLVEAMKRGSYIVNTARGGLLNSSELFWGLETGKLAGVALDVFPEEPPINNVLIQHPNCYVTAHIGGSSEEAVFSMGMAAIHGLENNKHALDFLNDY